MRNHSPQKRVSLISWSGMSFTARLAFRSTEYVLFGNGNDCQRIDSFVFLIEFFESNELSINSKSMKLIFV